MYVKILIQPNKEHHAHAILHLCKKDVVVFKNLFYLKIAF